MGRCTDKKESRPLAPWDAQNRSTEPLTLQILHVEASHDDGCASMARCRRRVTEEIEVSRDVLGIHQASPNNAFGKLAALR